MLFLFLGTLIVWCREEEMRKDAHYEAAENSLVETLAAIQGSPPLADITPPLQATLRLVPAVRRELQCVSNCHYCNHFLGCRNRVC